MSKDNQDKKNKPRMPENPGNRDFNRKEQPRSRAGLIWLIIAVGLVVLYLVNQGRDEKVSELKQSEFWRCLENQDVATAVVIPDKNDGVYEISGKLKHDSSKYRTRVIMSDDLNAKLRQNTDCTVDPGSSGFWPSFLLSILPVLLFVVLFYFIAMRQMHSGGKGAFDFGRSKAKMIPPDELNVHFTDIAGADEAKEEIAEVVEYLRDPLRFQLVGGKIPKGCLLVGEPGTGKTLMAKAVACEAGVPFFSISGSDFVEMFVGVGASRVRDMFEKARKNMPCLIFIDEIDAVGRSRFSGWGGGHDEREQTLNAMLVEMDGLESRNGVIVLAATNRPDVLDPALLRPGRFDRQVVMDLPDIAGRRQILDVHVKNIKVDDTVNLDIIARTTPGFSGAELANLCNEAALLAARRNLQFVTQREMEDARDKVSYGTERRSRRITDRERRLTAYHEAGHTLVAMHNSYCQPVHKVTIIPRGQAALGATFMMPKEDTYTKTCLELKADMAMALGGRVAEELVFGDITTGATADIQHLTGIARRMVCIFGMSSKLGPVKMGDFSNHPHMRIDGPPPEYVSNDTEREIDLEVRALINTAYEEAKKCLSEHRDQLDRIAAALLDKETLSDVEVRALLTPPAEVDAAPDATADDGKNSVADAADREAASPDSNAGQ